MVDLTVRIGGLELPSPIFVGSGPNTRTADSCVEAFNAGAGAVEVWGPPGDSDPRNHTRFDEIRILPSPKDVVGNRYFTLASTGGSRATNKQDYSIETRLNVIREVKERTDGKGVVVSSIGAVHYRLGPGPHNGPTWGELARMSEEAGADAVILHLQTGQNLAGKFLMENPERLPCIVEDVKRSSSIPIIAKLPIEGCDPVDLARLGFDCGAAIVAPTARYVGLDLDIESETVPEWGAFHGIGGPWALPITAAWTARMRRQGLTGPLIPGGGVMSWEDIVKLILVGADMIQVCSWPILKGYPILRTALNQVRRWMDSKGYESLADFRGNSISGLKDAGQMWTRFLEDGPHHDVEVNQDLCDGCRHCIHPCFWDAIHMVGKKAQIDPENCIGCGCCVSVCPSHSIETAADFATHLDRESDKRHG